MTLQRPILDLVQEEEARNLRLFCAGLASAMYPFRPGRVLVYYDSYDNYDFNDYVYKLTVEISAFPEQSVTVPVDMDYNVEETASRTGYLAGKAFMQLPVPPLTLNINLGEN